MILVIFCGDNVDLMVAEVGEGKPILLQISQCLTFP